MDKNSRVETLIKNMSLEEKIAQLCSGWLGHVMEDGKISFEKCREAFPYGIGHLGQFLSPIDMSGEEIMRLVDDLQEYLTTETPSKIPVQVHEEVITGVSAKGATVTPQMLGMSCSWNPKLVYENACMTAKTMKDLGCYYALSPVLDVITDARWGRAEEGFGQDSYLVTAFACAFIKGLQESGCAATAKHYAGYGVDNQEFAFTRNNPLAPFEAAVKFADVKAVMSAYHAFRGVPCSASEFLLNQVLRKEWGFDGIVVSDYGAIHHVAENYHYVPTLRDSAIACITAGVDCEFVSQECYSNLIDAVRDGEISESVIDTSVRRVLNLKAELGLLDKPAKPEGKLELDPPENRAQALKSAQQTIVLLKNDGVLPLSDKKPMKIAVVGPNADSRYSLLGDYAYDSLGEFFHHRKGDSENPKLITLLSGIKNKFGDSAEINFARGCDWSNDNDRMKDTVFGDERAVNAGREPLEDIPETNWDAAMALAKESDVIIAGVGENRFLCGEACDRENVNLPGDQDRFVKELCSLGKPVILVVFGGRGMAISEAAKGCAAVLYAWYPGEEGGNAIADIVSGTVSPTAKLTTTLPDSNADVPVFYQQGEHSDNSMFPFGFGLTYTEFEYGNLKVTDAVSVDDEYFDISFDIKNTGSCDAAEIAQVYLDSDTEEKQLIGFAREELKSGESRSVALRFYLDTFAKYDDEGNLFLHPGNFTVQIGASSADIRLDAPLEITGDVKQLKEKIHFFSDKPHA